MNDYNNDDYIDGCCAECLLEDDGNCGAFGKPCCKVSRDTLSNAVCVSKQAKKLAEYEKLGSPEEIRMAMSTAVDSLRDMMRWIAGDRMKCKASTQGDLIKDAALAVDGIWAIVMITKRIGER